jgi:hypothetical protein
MRAMNIRGKGRLLGRRLITCSVALCAVAGATAGLGATAAQAYGTGEACVFIEPQGAKFAGLNFGHIGWGYQVAGTSTWVYGATENPNGTPQIWAPAFNGAWKASGTWNDMLNTFTLQTDYPSHAVNSASNATNPGAPYTQYKCEAVANSNVTAANAAASANITAGYTLPSNDCLTAVDRVLSAYNAQNLPSLTFNPGPNAWYNALSPAYWNNPSGQLGETWENDNSGMFLDISGPSSNDGSIVHQWTYNGGNNQWWFRYGWNYGYVFTRYGPNHCLGVSGASTAAGAAVVEWTCNGSADQQWIFKPTGGHANGWPLYNIVNLKSHDCLGVAGGSMALGAPVVQWPCNGHPDQEWF